MTELIHDIQLFISSQIFSKPFVYQVGKFGLIMIIPLYIKCFFGSKGHVAQDRNPEPGYNTLLFRMIPGDILSACPQRQFHTLSGL